MTTPQHSDKFLELIAWVNEQIGPPDTQLPTGDAYTQYLIDLLQQIEEYFDRPPADE